MKRIGTLSRAKSMRGTTIIPIGLFLLAALPAFVCAATTVDIAAKVKTMKPQERINFLLKGAPLGFKVLAPTTLGKGSAMKGVRSKFKEFQLRPDYAVSPKLGAKLQNYIQDFRKILNAP